MLVTRTHADPETGTESEAIYSPCEKYRYALTRVWTPDVPRLTYIMLNPSKATEIANDPTVERCERRARRLGYGAMRVCNLFAWRETDPAELKRTQEPVGTDNDATLKEAAKWADHVLLAWGVHGSHIARNADAMRMLARYSDKLYCLGRTKHGLPRHPLYVSYAQPLERWT